MGSDQAVRNVVNSAVVTIERPVVELGAGADEGYEVRPVDRSPPLDGRRRVQEAGARGRTLLLGDFDPDQQGGVQVNGRRGHLRRAVGVLSIALLAIVASGGGSASAEPPAGEDSWDLPRDEYCNALAPTERCITQQLGLGPEPSMSPPPPTDAPNTCFLGEAGISIGGGLFSQEARGHSYIVCNHYNQALGITVVLTPNPASGQFVYNDIIVPMGVNGSSAGGWACATNFVCAVSSEPASGYGTRNCWTLNAVGSATSPYQGTPREETSRCANY